MPAAALGLRPPCQRCVHSGARSARHTLRGIVTKVVRDTVMAQVEMRAGPFRVVSLMSLEAADELALGDRDPHLPGLSHAPDRDAGPGHRRPAISASRVPRTSGEEPLSVRRPAVPPA